jgi:hypothetical protein
LAIGEFGEIAGFPKLHFFAAHTAFGRMSSSREDNANALGRDLAEAVTGAAPLHADDLVLGCVETLAFAVLLAEGAADAEALAKRARRAFAERAQVLTWESTA